MTTPDQAMRAVFRRPFPEQIAAFRLRLGNLLPTEAWDDLMHEAHDRAFVVAGATKADLLADFALAVDKSISQGTTLEEFRRDFRQIVEKHDWRGWTGEGTAKGEAWRTKVIYKTNAATSYAAGRMAQLRAAGFRYFIYKHGGSLHPRHHHLELDGLILRSDHPFWDIWAPPNGWGCSCYIIGAHSLAQAKRLGGNPAIDPPENWDVFDAETGAPAGIDKGWAYAPGASAADAIQNLTPKLDRLPQFLAAALLRDWVSSSAFVKWMRAPKGKWPMAQIPAADADALGAATRTAHISAATIQKQIRHHPELTIEDYIAVQDIVDHAAQRLLTQNARTGTWSQIYVHVIDDDETGGFVLVVKATRSGDELFITSLRKLSREAARRDDEIARLLRNASGN